MRTTTRKSRLRVVAHALALVSLLFGLMPVRPAMAAASLSVMPVTWNVIGLDSNDVTVGPSNFPVGARVCNSGVDPATNVLATFVWDDGLDLFNGHSYINLRDLSLSTISLPSLASGACSDFYFEVDIKRDPGAYDQTRAYHVDITADGGISLSTAQPREIYVEHLISQNRNTTSDVLLDGVSVPAGGTMALVVGHTYTITLVANTATNGYEQIETFIQFPNTIFRVLNVTTTYTAESSATMSPPYDRLYGDACVWENDPNSPNYRACNSVGKAGGDITVEYEIEVIGGGGSTETLNNLIYDFSGSSFHYNSDYSVGARLAAIIDPNSLTIDKSFSPNPSSAGGVSRLTFTISNPNGAALGDISFDDTLPTSPGAMVVADPPNASTSGCGSPTFAPSANDTALSFSDGTVAANGTCTVSVNVIAPVAGDYDNDSENLYVGGQDTGHDAQDKLTVTDAPLPPAPTCGLTLAEWTFDGYIANPPTPSTQSGDVATADLTSGNGLGFTPDTGQGDPVPSLAAFGWLKNDPIDTATSPYLQFEIDTSEYSGVQLQFEGRKKSNGPDSMEIYYSTDGATWNLESAFTLTTTFQTFAYDFTGDTNTGGSTYFRIYGNGANTTSSGADMNMDNALFSGCKAPDPPNIAKAFADDPIAVGDTTTLTFTLTNPNSIELTGVAFSDSLPTGMQVAGTPAASTTCGNTPSWSPGAADTSLDFGNPTAASIPANSSCAVSVDVTLTTSGPHENVSGYVTSSEGGTNTGPDGSASAALTGLLPPVISKSFSPDEILAGGTSTLAFTISNPNQDDALTGVAFSDSLPTSPDAMLVAGTPNAATSGCGAPSFSPTSGDDTLTFSGGTIAAGGTCIVSVDMTAPSLGVYSNTSGAVTADITGNGNTASDSLTVVNPDPGIALLKQVGTTSDPDGTWTSFVAVTAGNDVYYRFTLENVGDVDLTDVTVVDNQLAGTGDDPAGCAWPDPLPVADASDDDHIAVCVVGPVVAADGSHSNTAYGQGTYSSTDYTSGYSTATYATTGLSLDKSALESSFTVVGDQLHYEYLVSNSGSATLSGPVTVTDDKATASCPALTTVGDNDNFLDPGESLTCTATYDIVPGDVAASQVTNTATAHAGGVDSNDDSVTVPASFSADLRLEKTAPTTTPIQGDNLEFTITVTNDGPSDATGVTVQDTLPAGLTHQADDGGGSYSGGIWDIGDLASGDSATLKITVLVDTANPVDNIAQVWTSDQSDPDSVPGNDDSSEDDYGIVSLTPVAAEVTLDKSISAGDPYSAVGDNIAYSYLVSNTGGVTLAGPVSVADNKATVTCPNVNTVGNFDGNLDPGESVTCSASYTVDQGDLDAGSVTNLATATVDSVSSTQESATANADQQPQLSILKELISNADEDASGTVTVGDTLSYRVTATNTGNITLNNVVVNDPMLTPDTENCANLAVGADCILNGTYVVTLGDAVAGSVDNTASADADELATPVEDSHSEPVGSDLLPVAADDSNTADEGGPDVSGDLFGNDFLGNEPTTVTAADQGGNAITIGTPFDIAGGGVLTINADGTYTYTPPPYGSVPPAGLTEDFNYTITDDDGDTSSAVLSITIGNVDYAEVSGLAWDDQNVNGVQDAGEPGLANVTVNLYDSAGTTILDSTTTDSNGNYSFTVLTAGDYHVGFELPAGYTFTDQDQGGDDSLDSDADSGSGQTALFSLALGDTLANVDAGMYQPGVIGGQVREDQDIDGDLADADPGIAGVTVELYADADDDGLPDGPALATTVTDTNGYYGFSGQTAGDYVVVETDLADYTSTNDSDGTAQNDENQVAVTLAADASVTGNDFLDYKLSTIGELVWRDQNGNGVQDAGENGIQNVTVDLYRDENGDNQLDGGDSLLQTDTTDASGIFGFGSLPPGDYLIIVSDTNGALSGLALTTANQPFAFTITISGQTLTNANFGYESGPAALAKDLVAIDELPNTVPDDITIGEILVYEIRVTFAAGAEHVDATVTDVLDRGLAFMDCDPVDVSADAGLTTSLASFADICSPDTGVPLNGNPAISEYPSGSADSQDEGRQLVFSLGDVENTAGVEQVLTFRYRAIVLNIADNVRGVDLNNGAYWGAGLKNANADEVTVVEPVLDIKKTVSSSTAAPGDRLTFSLELSHAPASNSDAFGVVIDDQVQFPFTYVPGSLRFVSGQVPTLLDESAAPALQITWNEFLDNGVSSVIEFDVVVGAIPPGSSADNTAYAEWSSFPGDRTAAQSPFNIHSMERWYDPPDPLNVYGGISSTAVIQALTPANSNRLDGQLTWPATGFAPGVVTSLGQQPAQLPYADLGDMWLEIPTLGVELPVVGVPFTHEGWDVAWLANQAGYLEGTAYPTLPGNTVLTGHVWNADGLPGPFRYLPNLVYGDQLTLHVDGLQYVYEVRGNRSIHPWDLSPLTGSDYDWLILITCRDYDPNTDSYPLRTKVSAVLVSIAADD